jgi:hypothetical protein
VFHIYSVDQNSLHKYFIATPLINSNNLFQHVRANNYEITAIPAVLNPQMCVWLERCPWNLRIARPNPDPISKFLFLWTSKNHKEITISQKMYIPCATIRVHPEFW